MEPNIIGPEITPASPPQFSKTAIASLIIGILSLPLIVLKIGIIAVVVGIISIFKIRKHGLKGKGIAIAGIVIGLISMAMSLIPIGTYFELLFNPNKLSGIKSESTLGILNTDAQLIEQYKSTNGKYPAKFYDVPSILPSIYQIYYQLSADGKSYILRSNGVDGICGNEDDILPSASNQPQVINCVVDLGSGASTTTSAIKNNAGEFKTLSTYSSVNYGFSMQYPSVWRVKEYSASEIDPPAEWEVYLRKVDPKYASNTSGFGGAEFSVVVYNASTVREYLQKKSISSDVLSYVVKISSWGTPTVTKTKFLGYDTTSLEEVRDRGYQYIGQKTNKKTIIFQKGNLVFAVGYEIDTTLPDKNAMDTAINSFQFSK